MYMRVSLDIFCIFTFKNCYFFHYFVGTSETLSVQTSLILFSNSEPPRLRDVVSHLITIETTINTRTHTYL